MDRGTLRATVHGTDTLLHSVTGGEQGAPEEMLEEAADEFLQELTS